MTRRFHRLIHYIDTSSSECQSGKWKIKAWTVPELEAFVAETDKTTGSNHLTNYNKIQSAEDKTEFLKYIVLFYAGGLFSSEYPGDSLININELVKYCELRSVSLFDSPTITATAIDHHPEILGLLSEDTFRSLTHPFKNPRFHSKQGIKTVITTLSLNEYVVQIENDIKLKYTSVLSALAGFVGGMLFYAAIKK